MVCVDVVQVKIRRLRIGFAWHRQHMGGDPGPTLFGWLIESGQRDHIMWGYLAAAALMLVAAATEWRLGFAAEGKPLEEVARPLSAAQERP